MARSRNEVKTVFVGEDRTSDDIKRIQKNLAKLEKQTKKFGTTLTNALGFGGGAFAVQQLASQFNNMVGELDEIAKMSRQLGVTTEWLSEMQQGARKAGIRVREFDIGLQRMGRRAAQAAEGGGEAVAAFDRLGVTLVKADGRLSTIDEILPQIADGLQGVTDQTEKLALAQKIFDSEGVKLLRILDEGAAGLREIEKAGKDAGATLSGEAAADIEAYTDALEDLKLVGRQATLSIVQLAKAALANPLNDPKALGPAPGGFKLEDTTTPTGGAVGFDPRAAEKAFPTPEMVSDLELEYELLDDAINDVSGGLAENMRLSAEWGELGGRSIRLISQDVSDLGFEALGTGRMMEVAAQQSREGFEQLIPVLDTIIEKLLGATDAAGWFAESVKGAAAGFVTGGPLGAIVGAVTPFLGEVFGREGSGARG